MTKNVSPILSQLQRAATSEVLAVEFLEQQRWGDAPACPRCGSVAVYQMKSVDGERNADYRWRCRDCAKMTGAKAMFTVRTGTIFEETRLSLRIWVHAFWRAAASKKGISALQLSREMGCTREQEAPADYLNEFEFCHNTRKMDDGHRVSAAIKKVQGKRLEYRESVDNPPYLPEALGQMDAPLTED